MSSEINLQDTMRQVGTHDDWKYVESMSEIQARAMTSLWVRGASYMEIADEWQVSTAVARLAVERTLASSLDDSEDRSKQRMRLVMQYDAMLKAILPRAMKKNKEQLGFARLALQIDVQKSKLLGLDAPSEVNLNIASPQEIQEWAAQVLALKGAQMPVEGDPFMLTQNPDTGVYEEEVDDDA